MLWRDSLVCKGGLVVGSVLWFKPTGATHASSSIHTLMHNVRIDLYLLIRAQGWTNQNRRKRELLRAMAPSYNLPIISPKHF